jgi:hypothetical protein
MPLTGSADHDLCDQRCKKGWNAGAFPEIIQAGRNIKEYYLSFSKINDIFNV